MQLFQVLRERLSGKAPPRFQQVPPWARCRKQVTTEEKEEHERLNTYSGGQSSLLTRVAAAWSVSDFIELNRCLFECSAYFDPSKPHLLAYFVGLGGIDLFVTILCDVNVPKIPANCFIDSWRSQYKYSPSHLLNVIMLLLRVLTELLVCHSELGWYCYDRYPGLFFQLLELAKVPDLRLPALVMLEHLLLGVGPVLEISRVPQLQELLRIDDDVTLAIMCRVVALLIVPGVVLNQRTLPFQRLVFPEPLLPLQRIQRIIDSNVLWLIGEKRLVERLVKLCKVRPSGDIRVAIFEGALNVSEQQLSEVFRGGWRLNTLSSSLPFLNVRDAIELPEVSLGNAEAAWASRAAAVAQDVSGGVLEERSNHTSRSSVSVLSNSSSSSSSSSSGGGSSNGEQVARAIPRLQRDLVAIDILGELPVPLQRFVSDVAAGMWTEFDALSAPSDNSAGSNVDFSWFVGCVDAKQRWQLRDLTLSEEVDDNRPYLCGFGPSADRAAREAFQKQSNAFWQFLLPAVHNSSPQHSAHLIVPAQSEVLFVLNMMMSTFFFGDVWRALRDCKWVEVASAFFDTAFEPREGNRVVPAYVEQLRQLTELHALPRFLTAREASGEVLGKHKKFRRFRRGCRVNEEGRGSAPSGGAMAHEGDGPGKSAGGQGIDSTASSDGDDVSSSSSDEEVGRLMCLVGYAEDVEAYIQRNGHSESVDDDDGLEEKCHNNEGDTIRKLELLRSLQEFWNAQDRSECLKLQEGDTPVQSSPLAEKIAATLIRRTEDSCVETSACQTLEVYLRCFSFGVDRAVPHAPQTVLGAILMRSILEHRLYNATYVPGLSDSLFPSRRMESAFSLLGELIRYHYGNLSLLQEYVMGAVDLTPLNSPLSTVSSQTRQVQAASTRVERLLSCPPLDRGEHEPFASVLLRRMRHCGCGANLFLRSLFLSLTPGLRSRINYVWKPVTPATVDAKESLTKAALVGDIMTGHHNRFNYIARCSRWFVALISARRQCVAEGRDGVESEVDRATSGVDSTCLSSSCAHSPPPPCGTCCRFSCLAHTVLHQKSGPSHSSLMITTEPSCWGRWSFHRSGLLSSCAAAVPRNVGQEGRWSALLCWTGECAVA
ncbi:hypothetical protein ERJ75_001169300 [Trypanosoma vivax]|nr:hypothetical protein ERJ75_001169300 [Trypanosoma vivax]